MPDKTLQIYLPSFLLAFLLITFLWKWVRILIRINQNPKIEENTSYRRIKRIDVIYLLIFIIFGLIISVYTFYHDLYYIFIPLEPFDHPIINSFGLLLLKIAFIIVVIAQVHIDKELYKYSRDMSNLKAMELVYYSERMLLGGLALMFIGMFVTLTNVLGILLGVLAVLIYFKAFTVKQATY